jgi:hypothetical protein
MIKSVEALSRSTTTVFIAEIEGTVELYLFVQPVPCLSKITEAEALCISATTMFSTEKEGTIELYL